MKIERTKNASRNMISGIILKIYQLVIPFLMRTVVVYFLGIQYLGLNSLFYSILQVLNMAELGVSGAITFSMYKPIADDDTKTICALMQLYKIYYRIIGLIILIVGLFVVPFLPQLIANDVPSNMNIYILYLLNLVATVISYWLFAYKTCLLNAHQRVDIISKVTIGTSTLQYLLQFCALWIFRNYYLYAVIALFTQALTNILSSLVVDRMYPYYRAKGDLPKESVRVINGRIKDMFTAKVATTFASSFDTLVISSMLGLTTLAIYNNYSYITSGIAGVVGVIYGACSAGIGNSLVIETKEKNYNDLKKFTFIISWITGFCVVCLICLFQPFMKVWMGDNLLEFRTVICICSAYYIAEIARLLSTYKDVAGMWHEDRFRPLISSIVNLILNLVFVRFLGIFGILLATNISAIFVNLPWLMNNLFHKLFQGYTFDYLKRLLYYMIITAVSCFISYRVCTIWKWESFVGVIGKGIICAIISNTIFAIAYFRMGEFSEALELGKRVFKSIIKAQ